jgi:rfaE bifunctional protein kinase chain/domain
MTELDRMSNVRVLVVGDIILDRYWWGRVKRISPEAPVPVVDLQRSSYAAGGAANVAANVAGLGVKCSMIGCVGDDSEGRLVCDRLNEAGVDTENTLRDTDRPTMVKTRVIAHSQQVVRVDQEPSASYTDRQHSAVWERLERALPDASVVIVSDYGKGLLSDDLLSRLLKECRRTGKLVAVDPKGKDYSRYRGCSLITPNKKEAAEACSLDEDAKGMIETAGAQLLEQLDAPMVLITQGEDGMTLFEPGKQPVNIPAVAKEIYDVTGAGDTVIACMGTALAAGMSFADAAVLANTAAGIVVQQVGTTAITRQMLEDHLSAAQPVVAAI